MDPNSANNFTLPKWMYSDTANNFVVEKLKDSDSAKNFVVQKLKDSDGAKNFVVEKLKDLWLLISTFAAYILQVFDDKFPPETRDEKFHHWFKVSEPWLITGSLLVVLSFCCYRCCCKKRSRGGRMMKAPGQDFRMLRNDFEVNPKSYFRGLRGTAKQSQLLG